MISVLFVCMGNICRSPMAEAVFQDMVIRAGLNDRITCDSAGTGGWHAGETAHRGTLEVLRRHHIAYNGRARQVTSRDLDTFDYVLAMDRENLRSIERLGRPRNQTQFGLFLRYANDAGTVGETEVPDPYYDGQFDRVFDLVSAGCAALLAHIRARHNM